MKIIQLGLFLIVCTLAFGQESLDSSQKAPAPVDEALRSRVNQFYQAYVSGKFRNAYLLVADESQDVFMESSKNQWKSCETIKTDYTDNFTKATVLESCLGVYRWHNADIPTKVPLATNWKLVDGQWLWYYVRPKEVDTPWGKIKMPPVSGTSTAPTGTESRPVMPDPQQAAAAILKQVRVDKKEIRLLGYESSRDELHIRNEMPGSVSFNFDAVPLPGLKITPQQGDVKAHEEVTVVFEYKLDDPNATKGTKPTLTTQLHMQPTMQTFPVTITFAIPPEVEKQIPEELRKPKSKQ